MLTLLIFQLSRLLSWLRRKYTLSGARNTVHLSLPQRQLYALCYIIQTCLGKLLGHLCLEQEEDCQCESVALANILVKNKVKVKTLSNLKEDILASAVAGEKIDPSFLDIPAMVSVLLRLEIFHVSCTRNSLKNPIVEKNVESHRCSPSSKCCNICDDCMYCILKDNSFKNLHELIEKLVKKEEIDVCSTLRLRLAIEYSKVFRNVVFHMSLDQWKNLSSNSQFYHCEDGFQKSFKTLADLIALARFICEQIIGEIMPNY